jgi:hypothetical protein
MLRTRSTGPGRNRHLYRVRVSRAVSADAHPVVGGSVTVVDLQFGEAGAGGGQLVFEGEDAGGGLELTAGVAAVPTHRNEWGEGGGHKATQERGLDIE